MSAGIGAHGDDPKLWTLEDLDRGVTIVGQFIPQGVTKTVEGSIAQAGSQNAQFPILQWTSGELEVITFSARLWATDSTDFSVEDRLDALENLVKRQEDLDRPPVCTFAWGDVSSLVVDGLVKAIGRSTYDEIRNDGTLRGVSLQITLWRYEPLEFTVTDPALPERMTRIRRAKQADTYESIALDEYGNPLLGVLLRQLNPRIPGMELADLKAKDPVHVYPEDYLVTLPVEPEFHGFRTGEGYETAEERRRELFDARGGDAFVTFYADLPEGS